MLADKTLRWMLLTSAMWLGGTLTSQAQFGPTRVSVAPVELYRDVTGGHSFVGTVHPRRRSTVGSAVNGRVVEFLVNDGDAVRKGQPLARLLTRQLDIQIAAARAERELRAHELAEMRNGSRPEEKREAAAQMETNKALNDFAQQKLQRTRTLFERNVATEEQLQDDIRLAAAASSGLAAAEARHRLVEEGPRPEKVAQAEARLASAEEEINRLLDLLEKHTMISPFDGYVVREFTEVGQWITSGEPVAEIVQIDEVEIEAQVLETFLPRVRIGALARVDLAAIPDQLFEGRVLSIVPQAELRSRSFPVRVLLSNPPSADGQPLVKPGMFARVVLPVEPKKEVLMVPKDALVLGGPEPVVFVVGPDPQDSKKERARQVPVKLGLSDATRIEVTGLLEPGDSVVIEGNERLFPGAEVSVTKRVPPRAPGAST